MHLLWFVLSITLLVGEMLLPNFVLFWFGIGALCGVVLALLGVPIWIQVAGVIGVSFILCSKFTNKLVKSKSSYTSVMEITEGTLGIVKDKISITHTGTVVINGQEWVARCVDSSEITEGKTIEVVKTGVVLVVKEVENK